jgi:hypothetical protein
MVRSISLSNRIVNTDGARWGEVKITGAVRHHISGFRTEMALSLSIKEFEVAGTAAATLENTIIVTNIVKPVDRIKIYVLRCVLSFTIEAPSGQVCYCPEGAYSPNGYG